MDGSVGASPGEQTGKGRWRRGQEERPEPSRNSAGKGLSRSIREEVVRQAGPLPRWQSPKRWPRTSRYLLVPSQRGCKPGFPKGLGRAGSEGLASSLPSPRGPWVLLLVAPAPHGPGRTCWAQRGQGQRPVPPTPHPLPRGSTGLDPCGHSTQGCRDRLVSPRPVSTAGMGPLAAAHSLPGLLLAIGGHGSCSSGPPELCCPAMQGWGQASDPEAHWLGRWPHITSPVGETELIGSAVLEESWFPTGLHHC